MNATQTATTQKDLAAEIRTQISKAGVKATVRKYTSCGVNWIRVSVIKADAIFTPLDQATVKTVAKMKGLTMARGLPILMDQSVNPQEFHFVAP